jgi:hypothetical protein
MRVVQALYWLKDTLGTDRERVLARLTQVLADPTHGQSIRDDLLQGLSAIPAWMQVLVRALPGCTPTMPEAPTPTSRASKRRHANPRQPTHATR